MMGNVALYQVHRKQYAPVAVAAVLVVACVAFGHWRMSQGDFDGIPVRAAAVQANVPQDQKWLEGQVDTTLDTYLSLSQKAVDEKAELIAWPETACTFYLFQAS
jgi:apolipoprotein N-acyltransferase